MSKKVVMSLEDFKKTTEILSTLLETCYGCLIPLDNGLGYEARIPEIPVNTGFSMLLGTVSYSDGEVVIERPIDWYLEDDD